MRPLPFILQFLPLAAAACSGGGGGAGGDAVSNAYPDLAQETLVSGPARFRVWLADDSASRAAGLMDATRADLAPLPDGTRRGMLFVFAVATDVAFWMKDTEVPLDIAYLDESGKILAVHALIPLDETPVPSPGPIRYALEVRAGELGIGVGDVIDIPGSG
jgi:uncharacterized membrane protein (UPF0127 family)